MCKVERLSRLGVIDLPAQLGSSQIIYALERFFRLGESKALAQALRNQGIGAIAFDMDGTLANTEAINLQIVEEGLLEHGIRLTDSERREYIGTTIKSFAQMILQRRGIDAAESKASTISDSKDKKFPDFLATGKIKLFDRVVHLVKALRKEGFRLALVTSSKRSIMEMLLGHFNLTNYFQVRLGREDAESSIKPDPFIYKKAIGLLNFASEPNKVLAFEDSGPGINSAHRAGTNVVVIKNLAEQNPEDVPSGGRVHRLDMTSL